MYMYKHTQICDLVFKKTAHFISYIHRQIDVYLFAFTNDEVTLSG